MLPTRPRHPWLWAGAGVGAAAFALQLRLMRSVAGDPEQAVLREPPRGRPLQIRSADGTELHAEVFGDGSGQTIVLAHGWTEALAYWVYVIRALSAEGFRVVAYDLRGHGASAPAAGGDYAMARFGEDVEAVLEASLTEGQRAIVVGHSLGAMSIAAWAEQHDVERLACGAALLNTGVGDLVAEQLLIPVPLVANAVNRVLPPQQVLGSRAPLPRFTTPLSHALTRYTAFGRHATPAQVAFYERMLIACPPDVRADAGLAISEMELHHALPRLTVPTLVMAGADDRLTPPSHARRIADALPHLHRLVIVPEMGHMGPLERPTEVIEALRELAAAVAPVAA